MCNQIRPTHLLVLYGLFLTCFYDSKKNQKKGNIEWDIKLCYTHISGLTDKVFWITATFIHFCVGWGCWRMAVAEAQSWDRLCVPKAQGIRYPAVTEKGCGAPLSHTLFLCYLVICSSKKPTFNILSGSHFAKVQQFIRNIPFGTVLPIALFFFNEALFFLASNSDLSPFSSLS